MKQLIVGLAVLAVFVAYCIGVRHEQPVVAKVATTQTPQSGKTNTGDTTSSNDASNSSSSASGSQSTQNSGQYKNGTYIGSTEDAFYGNVQVSVTVSGGKISDVTFLQYPNTHSDSVMINDQAMPLLTQEAIQAQSAQVDIISGATFTSQAFIQSMAHALSQA